MILMDYYIIKQIIKENWKSIIIMLIFIIAVNIPLPYYMEAPGGTINLTKRIENMPTLTKEWQGNSADEFAEIVKEQKEKEFNPFMIKLQAYSNALKNIAEDFDNVERNTKL